ncbi:MAG: SAM-dependent methyltransferase [Sciscionella sp.]
MGEQPQTEDLSWIGGEIDLSIPNAARMYDYYLGGAHNFAVDREQAKRAITVIPQIVPGARANRAFLQRAVRYCLDRGIRQFLDLGSGIPTVGHVHELAARVDPPARVAYVDNEPVAVAHTTRMVADLPNVTMTQADLRHPDQVLRAPGVVDLLDFTQPVAVMLCAVLHFVADENEAVALVAGYRDACAPGSYLVASHVHDHYDTPERIAESLRLYSTSSNPMVLRDLERFAALLPGTTPVEPGVVYPQHWHPEPNDPLPEHPERVGYYVTVSAIN